jgi:hypothetical protein
MNKSTSCAVPAPVMHGYLSQAVGEIATTFDLATRVDGGL